MTYKIETDFIVDYSDDEPKRLVRLTMDAASLSALRRSIYEGADYGQYAGAAPDQTATAYGLADFLRRVETELSQPSLFSLDEFKATNGDKSWL